MKVMNDYQKTINTHQQKLRLVFKGIIVGLSASIVTIFYRFLISVSGKYSQMIYAFIRQHLLFIIPLLISLIIIGFLIGKLVRQYPQIAGSGIPQVKGVLLGYFRYSWFMTLVAKILAGSVAILAGLSLGREGPSIQLGATTAQGVSEHTSKTRTERKILIASGASAGLAAAFNAPLAGVMFTLEEVFKYFSPTILLVTITSAVSADFLSQLVFGSEPIFQFSLNQAIPLHHYYLVIILGVIAGLFGAFYNFTLLKTMFIYKKIALYNKHLKFIIPFVIAGIMGLTFPIVLGGGDHIIEELNIQKGIQWLIIVLVVKYLFTMISSASGVPGGIFFPLLVLGALIGGLYGNTVIQVFGLNSNLFYNFIILAMAGYFAAIVRAPITGIILLTEMTKSFSHILPLTLVSIVSYLTAELLRSKPIYDSLLELQLENNHENKDELDHSRKITIERVVHHGSKIEGGFIKDLSLPIGSLVIAIRRNDRDITPSGTTSILAEDYLIILTSLKDEAKIHKVLDDMTEYHE